MLKIAVTVTGLYATNTYLIIDEKTGEAAVIDPAVADDDVPKEVPVEEKIEQSTPEDIVVGDVVKVVANAKYATGQKVPAWVRKKE